MEIIKKTLQVEEKYKLNSFKVNGFHPWVYTRRSIMRGIFNQLYRNQSYFDYAQSTEHISLREKAGEKAKFYLHSLRVLLSRKGHIRKNTDILFVNSPRRQLIDGKYECIITDELAGNFANSLSLERTVDGMRYTPAKTKNLVYFDEVILFRRLAHKLTEKYLRRKKNEYNDVYSNILVNLEKPLKELYESYNMDANIENWVHEMTARYFRYRIYFRFYESLLRKVNPRLIIEVCHYDFHNMIITEVAKKLGITTVELQHGVVNNEHFAYNYPIGEKIPQFPDYFFVFSDYWKESLACPISMDKVIPVGYPYFDKCISKYKSTSTNASKDKVLVFLSQRGLGLEQLAVNVGTRMKNKGWRIIYKLHPREYNNWKAKYPTLVDPNIDVVDTHERTLYEVFSIGNAVIGAFSTSIFEAIGFGLAAFVIDKYDYDYIDDLCDRGFTTRVFDSDSLCSALENLNEEYHDRRTIFFKPNAIENMKTAISHLLSREI